MEEDPEIPNLVPLEDIGDLLTLQEFLDAVECGGFIDYDGMGNWATETHQESGSTDKWVYPSQIKNKTRIIPSWATHVMWYNR